MSDGIRIQNLTKCYGKKKALDGVSLTVSENELFGLLGVNGAGKTTLIHILCGLTKKSAGEALVGGFDVETQMDEIKRICDMSPQETSVAPNLTVKENLDFFADIYRQTDKAYLENVLSTFRLESVLSQKAGTLSGGWKRRLSIAIALVSRPKVLFLDEPTLGLDVLARRDLWEILRSLKSKITIVLTSHYLEEIEALCDRVAVMSDGRLLAIGSVEELKKQTDKSSLEETFVALVNGGTVS